ncbi:hypothetical protein LPB86_16575 [Pedobacter sp. MC2016-14]|uniref:hypothetical protein n=1 Tax=Pedobacter sp. MC2016-14 TaxID=2897327 RepID=UPI001E36EB66|nr:hypothetical protein [Pedobacter sp. MC2016-14]MCD0489861.1 hypothetical protein [Pedobacter sp. MC2016-14]
MAGIVDEEQGNPEPLIDEETGEELVPETSSLPVSPFIEEEARRVKVYVNGVYVSILVNRELHFDRKVNRLYYGFKDMKGGGTSLITKGL